MSAASDMRLMELKDTIAQLNTTISKQNNLIASLQKTLEQIQAKLEEKDQTISNLNAQLDYLKQKLFGSTSEPSRITMEGQLNLFQQLPDEPEAAEEDETKPAATIEPEEIDLSPKEETPKRRKKPDYEDLFGNLPTERIILDTLTEEQKTCIVCGTQMVPIGQEVLRTELKYTPPKLTRVEYIGTTWACPECKSNEGDNEFVKDKGAPTALIKGSYVSSGLAAHVLYAKYVLGLPLYRLEKDFENLGVRISRTTMANWVIECSKKYLVPMYDYFKRELLKRTYLMADETVLQVLKEPDQ